MRVLLGRNKTPFYWLIGERTKLQRRTQLQRYNSVPIMRSRERHQSAFFSKDNRTVILTRQDFLPDRTADGDLLFTFSSNILDFGRSLSSYLKFGSRHEDLSRFCR